MGGWCTCNEFEGLMHNSTMKLVYIDLAVGKVWDFEISLLNLPAWFYKHIADGYLEQGFQSETVASLGLNNPAFISEW